MKNIKYSLIIKIFVEKYLILIKFLNTKKGELDNYTPAFAIVQTG